ncbi:MAG: hypothetical protein ACQKBV_12445 [Puniceicoccales bacterium]
MERRLKEYRAKAERCDLNTQSRKILFEELAQEWAELRNASLKPSSADRNLRCIKQLTRNFKGLRVSEIRRADCEDWEVCRSKGLNSSTFHKEMEVLKAILAYPHQCMVGRK